MPYTIEFSTTYTDVIQGVGRQFNVTQEVTYAVHEIKATELATVIRAIQEKGYAVVAISLLTLRRANGDVTSQYVDDPRYGPNADTRDRLGGYQKI